MIIFCDFDGTLWRHSDTDFSELNNNIAAIKKWRNQTNKFVIASGRSLASIKRHQPNYTDFTDYFISDNGSFVFGQDQKAIIQNTLDDLQVAKIMQVAQQSIPASDIRTVYYSAFDETAQPTPNLGKIRLWLKDASQIDTLTARLHAALPNQLKIHHERHAINSSLPWVDPSFTAFMNVVSVKAGKESAIMQLLQLLNLSKDDAISIGDDLNDLEMLEHFNGHIMRDAHPQLLATFPPEKQHRTVADFIATL